MDRAADSFAQGLVVAAIAILVIAGAAAALAAWALARLRTPSGGLGRVLLAASFVPALPLGKWLVEGSLSWGRPLEWAIPMAVAIGLGGLGLAHLVGARHREARALADIDGNGEKP